MDGRGGKPVCRVDETCIIGVSYHSGFLEFWILFSVQSLVHTDSVAVFLILASRLLKSGLSVTSESFGDASGNFWFFPFFHGCYTGKCLRAISQRHPTLLSLLFCFHIIGGTLGCLLFSRVPLSLN